MTMVFAGIFAIFRQSMNLIETARDHTRVAQILQSEIESMRTMNWNDLEDLPEWQSFSPQGKFVQAYADRYSCYRWIFDRNSDQKEALLICGWYGNSGTYHQMVYRTFFTREGLNDYYYRAF